MKRVWCGSAWLCSSWCWRERTKQQRRGEGRGSEEWTDSGIRGGGVWLGERTSSERVRKAADLAL